MDQGQNRTRKKALNLLTRKDRTTHELRERLERDFPTEEVTEVINYLVDLGYLDDFRYARNYVDYRNSHRPSGNYLLRLELNRKGVSDQIIDQVLNTPEKEYELAFALAKKRLGALEKLEALTRMRRLYGLLQRRGFPSSTARRVLSDLLDRDLENEYN